MKPDRVLQDAMFHRLSDLYAKCGGLNDYQATPDLSVVDCELVERACGSGKTSNYVVTLDTGAKHKLKRVSQFVRQWNKSEYGGSNSASATGTEVHQAIAECFSGRWSEASSHLRSVDAHRCFSQFLAWWEVRCERSRPILSECRVWSIGLGVAGTVDLVLQTPNGFEVIDFKTGAMCPTYVLQARLYELCLAGLGIQCSRSTLVFLPRNGDWEELSLWNPQDTERRLWADFLISAFRSIEDAYPKISA